MAIAQLQAQRLYWSVLLEVQELEIASHFCFSKLEFFDMRTNFPAASCCTDVAKACELWIAYLSGTLIYWEYIWNSNCFTFQRYSNRYKVALLSLIIILFLYDPFVSALRLLDAGTSQVRYEERVELKRAKCVSLIELPIQIPKTNYTAYDC